MPIDMKELHNKVFDYLVNWSDTTKQANKYFYLRTKFDERFKMGYWFLGDDNYLAVSFWTGVDNINRTPNIYIRIEPQKGVYAFVIGKDSEKKKEFFDKEIIPFVMGYQQRKDKGITWRKRYGSFNENTLYSYLEQFIENDKVSIDERFRAKLGKIDEEDEALFEDEFVSKIGFISEDQFNKLRNRVETRRKAIELNLSVSTKKDFLIEQPIYLSTIDIVNFHGIKKLSLSGLPQDAKWIFLTGENGFGKTNVLQSISLGMTSYGENINYLEKNTRISIGFTHGSQYVRNSFGPNYSEDFTSLNSNFIAYGPIRLVVQASSSDNQENPKSNNIYSIFNRDGLLKNIISHLLKSMNKADDTEFKSLKDVIIKILDNRVSDITLNNDADVVFSEQDISGNAFGWNQLGHLATGFQSMLNMVGDIIIRLSKPGKDHHDFLGIIVIDELENHLHPIFQQKIPSLLSEIFPKLQFITSIHSPIPLLGAPKNSAIIKINRDAEDGISAERIIIDNIDALNPNILYSSPIFGFTSLISDNLVDKSKLRTEDSWQEMKDNDELDKQLIEMYRKRKGE